ncbi:hypothetical protein [Elizabethkingia anophelis]|uniref:hypothetical protein n=1 Tax=Elizabethkingia anophelis TaxID=1117645 RepID=UPI00320B6513
MKNLILLMSLLLGTLFYCQTISLIDSYTGVLVNYKKVTTMSSGTVITDQNMDGAVYRKKDGYYYERQFEGSVNPAWYGELTEKSINKALRIASIIGKDVELMNDYKIDCSGIDTGVKLLNNSVLRFSNNARLIAVPSSSGNYKMLDIDKVKNVKVYNPVIIGERNNHLSNTGEWGYGINITNSQNVEIRNPVVKDTWGDGIYIGGDYFDKTQAISTLTDNVLIYNPYIDNVRRNGISICSVGKVRVYNAVIKNVNGANPQSGIDIEPEGDTGVNVWLKDVEIHNPTTENCTGGGINVFLHHLANTETNIKILNHKDIGSGGGLALVGAPTGSNVTGNFDILNPTYIKNKLSGININWLHNTALKTSIINPTIVDYQAGSILQNPQDGSGIAVNGSNNLYIENPKISSTTTNGLSSFGLWSDPNLTNNIKISKLETVLPVKISDNVIVTNTEIYGSDSAYGDDVFHKIINKTSYSPVWNNRSSTGDLYIFEIKEIPQGNKVRVEVVKPYAVKLIAPAGVVGLSGIVQSSDIGSYIEITNSNGVYYVSGKNGNWQ